MILSSILRLIREYIQYNTFIQNPNPRPDPRIFKKIRPNPSAFKILRSVTTLIVINLYAKFEVSSLSHSGDIEGIPKFQMNTHAISLTECPQTDCLQQITTSRGIVSELVTWVDGLNAICQNGILWSECPRKSVMGQLRLSYITVRGLYPSGALERQRWPRSAPVSSDTLENCVCS